ncbi:MAG: amidophosphoribosyltransferase [Candidatus Marinimicrobia bacterium]|nr:amidophosphoribosyltransferase [Candidatus Neomarinimicrobiota bacterium]
MCGIVGIYGNPEAATLAYLGLYAQQHRGQEGAGIVTVDQGAIHRHMGEGLVSEVFHNPDLLDSLPGASAIGHTRYSTTGGIGSKNVGPLMFNVRDRAVSIAHNGNLINLSTIRHDLQEQGALFQTATDTELLIHLLAKSRHERLVDQLHEALLQVEGAYSLMILSEEGLIAARDPQGWRPFVIGKLDDTWVLASETCALDLIGAQELREVQPGEILLISESGLESVHQIPAVQPAHCIFEYIYFSRPDSRIFGANVDKMRRRLGRELAREAPAPTADIVISVPDSSNTAAIGYAQESGIRHEIGLIRNHYVGRSFIRPRQKLRDLTVKLKFNPVRGVLEDREIVLVDDSIVRGTTMKTLVKLIRDAGAKKVHVRISSPPIRNSCYFGLDFPTQSELIATQQTVEEVARFLGADSLAYLSLQGTLDAMDHDSDHFCTACFSGRYPLEVKEIPSKDMFELPLESVPVVVTAT